MNEEAVRLEQERTKEAPWKMWGPYLSERQWGTVREDYSASGDAWSYFPHDHARSRAYRWGEDGLAGISDDKQRLCFALALWNGVDPIIKERLFGLANGEGNHGEDVKEYYYYLDSTPTHSYMKYLYKYPQAPYPYGKIVTANRQRSRHEQEYELIDSGVFDEDRYHDVFVEYAKDGPQDILVRITVCNRGAQAATLHVLPTIWFRNTWTGRTDRDDRPRLATFESPQGMKVVRAVHKDLGERYLAFEGNVPLLFTENETNNERIFSEPNPSPYVKDAFDRCLVGGRRDAVNSAETGTKAAAHHVVTVPPGEVAVIRARLTAYRPTRAFDAGFDDVFARRKEEADEFYRSITPPRASEDEARVFRQALAGMLWSKQYYLYDVDEWLRQHGSHPLKSIRGPFRNREWYHMMNDAVVSMPDKWEYPWYAAWDLAFHTIALEVVDLDFAKSQLELLLTQDYIHPNGQLPSYEWNFGDVNPPVHAWAAWYVYNMERMKRGEGDLDFLKNIFNKLSMNFTWWVNRKDRAGRNAFEGGFLGLDNIGVFNRSAELPTGGYLEQADGTAWMGLFCQNLLQIAIELALHDRSYASVAFKFAEHFFLIANAMFGMGGEGMWDEEDGFFYDLLRLPSGQSTRLKVRSMVGLLPLCASTVIPTPLQERFPDAMKALSRRLHRLPELRQNLSHMEKVGYGGRRLLSMLDENRLRRVLGHMLDPAEFLSDYGIRALSRWHASHPFVYNVHGEDLRVEYDAAESPSGMFGGNSNWRGPIWFPVNALIIRALLNMYAYYGDDFKVECPTGSGSWMTLFEVSKDIAGRLTRIFLRDSDGRRPVFGAARKFQEDPNWNDHLLFYEYFHGDNGAGIGASHQTGWTGLVAALLQLFGAADPARILAEGTAASLLGRD
jgi:hypothetical protein